MSTQHTGTSHLRLPLSFDLALLRQDLARIAPTAWISHFNTSAYENGWSCVPLRSVDGRSDHIMPVESGRFEDTDILAGCPYFRHVVDQFDCEKTSIRLMALQAGSVIREHRDPGTALEDGVTRLHVPIQTSPPVLFRIEGQAVHFSAGDTWYLNASCLHAVSNPSQEARIHLMIDCVTNPWLEQMFLAAGGVLREPSPYADPTIHDGNALQIAAALRAGGHAAGLALAHQIEEIHARRQGPAAMP